MSHSSIRLGPRAPTELELHGLSESRARAASIRKPPGPASPDRGPSPPGLTGRSRARQQRPGEAHLAAAAARAGPRSSRRHRPVRLRLHAGTVTEAWRDRGAPPASAAPMGAAKRLLQGPSRLLGPPLQPSGTGDLGPQAALGLVVRWQGPTLRRLPRLSRP